MPVSAVTPDSSLDDVQVLGVWNFTLQGDTPLYWLRCGQLDRYLLKYRLSTPSPCTTGMVIHAEVDGPGSDGVSFWIDRRPGKDGREGTRRYMVAGEGLDSSPIVTRSFPDGGGEITEEVELLMEGYNGTILLQERKVSLKFRVKHSKGSVAFYNSTQGDNDNVHFNAVRITALRRGPLEVDGNFLKRERHLEKLDREGKLADPSAARTMSPAGSASPVKRKAAGQSQLSFASTMAPDPMSPQTRSTATAGVSTFGGRTVSEFRSTMPASGSQLSMGHLPSPTGSASALRSPMQLGGRGARTLPPGRLHPSASDSCLRDAGASRIGSVSPSWAGSPAQTRGTTGRSKKGPEKWVPLALNAPAGEQALLKAISRKPVASSNACTDFIAM